MRMEKKFRVLFENLCCSQCKSGFDENSFEIKRKEDGLLVTHLTCQNCGKSFGIAFVGVSNFDVKEPLEIKPEPISYDDVIDAHRFIKNLDENWKNYLKKYTDDSR